MSLGHLFFLHSPSLENFANWIKTTDNLFSLSFFCSLSLTASLCLSSKCIHVCFWGKNNSSIYSISVVLRCTAYKHYIIQIAFIIIVIIIIWFMKLVTNNNNLLSCVPVLSLVVVNCLMDWSCQLICSECRWSRWMASAHSHHLCISILFMRADLWENI